MLPPLLDIHSTCDSEALSWPNTLVVTSGPSPNRQSSLSGKSVSLHPTF